MPREVQGVSLKRNRTFTPWVGVFGEQLAASYHDDISIQFPYGVNTDYDVVAVVTGDGAVAGTGGNLCSVSSTTGTAYVESKDFVRNRPGHTARFLMTASFNGTGEGVIGAFNDDSGIWLKYSGGTITAGYRNGGVDTIATKFNGDLGVDGINWDNINIFEVTYGYLGVAPPMIRVLPRDQFQWHVLHTFLTAGVLNTTHIGTPIIPIRMETSGDMEILSASWSGGVLGDGSQIGARPFSWSGELTLSGTDIGTVVTFENMSTFNSKNNAVKVKLLRYEFFVDKPSNGDGTVQFDIIGNPSLTGTPSWTEEETGNSVMRYDTVQQYDSGGKPILTEWVGYSGSHNSGAAGGHVFDAAQIGAVGRPGEQFAILAQNVNGSTAVTVRVTFNWEELF
jgi:hypothetical protein